MALSPRKERTSSWGVRGVYATEVSNGVIVSGKLEVTAVKEPIRDVTGAVSRIVIYDYNVSAEIMVMCPTSFDPPKVGMQITCNFSDGGKVKGFVAKSSVQETNQTFRKVAVVVESSYKCAEAYKSADVTRYTGDAPSEPVSDYQFMD